jgi:hypothetical protein
MEPWSTLAWITLFVGSLISIVFIGGSEPVEFPEGTRMWFEDKVPDGWQAIRRQGRLVLGVKSNNKRIKQEAQ